MRSFSGIYWSRRIELSESDRVLDLPALLPRHKGFCGDDHGFYAVLNRRFGLDLEERRVMRGSVVRTFSGGAADSKVDAFNAMLGLYEIGEVLGSHAAARPGRFRRV